MSNKKYLKNRPFLKMSLFQKLTYFKNGSILKIGLFQKIRRRHNYWKRTIYFYTKNCDIFVVWGEGGSLDINVFATCWAFLSMKAMEILNRLLRVIAPSSEITFVEFVLNSSAEKSLSRDRISSIGSQLSANTVSSVSCINKSFDFCLSIFTFRLLKANNNLPIYNRSFQLNSNPPLN